MSRLLLILLIALMSVQTKEFEMAIEDRDLKQIQRARVTPRRAPALRPPAWLGGGAGAGLGQRKQPSWYEDEYQSYMSGTNAGDVSNPSVPIAALAQDSEPGAVQTRIKYGAPNLGTSDVRYQNQMNGAAPPSLTLPAGGGAFNYANRPYLQNNNALPNIPRPVGNVVNPNQMGMTEQGTPTMGVNTFIGGGGEAVAGPAGQGTQPYYPWMPKGVNTFIGGGGLAVRGPNDQAMWNPLPESTGGFGTYYGGNWRGGGGGYGGGNWGGGEYPAWLRMGLNDWNFRG
jgi:hypothetical protein